MESGNEGAVGPQLALFRGVWRMSCGVFLAFAVVATVLLLPAEILVLAVLVSLLTGATAASLYRDSKTARWTMWQVVTAAAEAGAVTTLALCLTAVLGPSVLWLLVLLAVASPPAVHWYCVGLRLGTTGHRVDVPQRSTADLCRQWHDSYHELRQAKTDTQRLRVVMERQRCLDELDRRDPEGLQAWLATTASAAGDPARFIKNP
jgi:hypothetical protein